MSSEVSGVTSRGIDRCHRRYRVSPREASKLSSKVSGVTSAGFEIVIEGIGRHLGRLRNCHRRYRASPREASKLSSKASGVTSRGIDGCHRRHRVSPREASKLSSKASGVTSRGIDGCHRRHRVSPRETSMDVIEGIRRYLEENQRQGVDDAHSGWGGLLRLFFGVGFRLGRGCFDLGEAGAVFHAALGTVAAGDVGARLLSIDSGHGTSSDRDCITRKSSPRIPPPDPL
jgi:hypothetical protein